MSLLVIRTEVLDENITEAELRAYSLAGQTLEALQLPANTRIKIHKPVRKGKHIWLNVTVFDGKERTILVKEERQ